MNLNFLFVFLLFHSKMQHQKRLTTSIENLLYFTIFILPVLQYVVTAILLITGISCLIIGVLRCMAANTNDYHNAKLNSSSLKFDMNCKLHENVIVNGWNIK